MKNDPHPTSTIALPPAKGPVLRDIMREHIEEIGTLRMQHLALRFRGDTNERALARLDARIAAHRDGLAEGAPVSVEVGVEMLEKAFDPWEVAAIVEALMALGSLSTDCPGRQCVETRLVEGPIDLLMGFFEGLRVTRAERVKTLAGLLPTLFQLGPRAAPLVGALGWHGLLDKRMATEALVHDEPAVRQALARALAWATPRDCDANALLGKLHEDRDLGVRRRAAWTEVVRSTASGIGGIRGLARRDSDPFALRVLELLEGKKAPEGAPPEAMEAAEADQRALSEAASADRAGIPNLLQWRIALGRDRSDLQARRRETPSRFFEDDPGDEVAPGL